MTTNDLVTRNAKKQPAYLGFLVRIQINCEDEREILAHLSVLRREIKKQLKKDGGEFTKNKLFQDDNCYGSHECKIKLY